MPETPKGPKRPAKNTRAAQEAAKAIGKAKVAAKATKASTPAKKGAPTTFNQKTADLICIGLSEGMSLRKILKADTAGVLPAQSTIYQWLLRHPSFQEQYTRAREEQAETLADEIIDIADEQPEIVVVTDKATGAVIEHKLDSAFLLWQKNRIEARKWTAAKLRPKKYGDRVALEGVEGGAPISTEDATASKFLEVIRNMEMTKRVG